MRIKSLFVLIAAVAGGDALFAGAQTQHHDAARHDAPSDTRQLVKFPESLRLHTISNMRDHLLALQEINEALAKGAFDKAASVAESRLGLSSLAKHGAHEVAPHMPKSMQDIGTEMHRAASRFAIEAQNAGVSNDVRAALGALGSVMQQCVACHATYRLH